MRPAENTLTWIFDKSHGDGIVAIYCRDRVTVQ